MKKFTKPSAISFNSFRGLVFPKKREDHHSQGGVGELLHITAAENSASVQGQEDRSFFYIERIQSSKLPCKFKNGNPKGLSKEVDWESLHTMEIPKEFTKK